MGFGVSPTGAIVGSKVAAMDCEVGAMVGSAVATTGGEFGCLVGSGGIAVGPGVSPCAGSVLSCCQRCTHSLYKFISANCGNSVGVVGEQACVHETKTYFAQWRFLYSNHFNASS